MKMVYGLVCLFVFLVSPSSAQAARPNILLIYTDDLGYGDLSCYGATAIQTPHLDSLAENGIRFTDAYASASTCTPSRYSLLTGHLAFRQPGTGILRGDATLIIDPQKQTLPSMLQKAGYETAVIGKWHLGLGLSGKGALDWNQAIAPGPNEIGFDYSYIIPATNDRVPCVYLKNGSVDGLDPKDPISINYRKKIGAEPTGKENPELLKVDSKKGDHHHGTIHGGVARIGYMTGGKSARWDDETIADTLIAQSKAFILQNRKKKEKPFFIYLSTVDVHAPRLYHPRFHGKSGLGPRGDMVLQLDDSVGQLLDFLKQENLLEDTLILFSSDNGPKLEDAYLDGSLAAAQKKNFNPAGPLRGRKYSLFEGGLRVPFIVSWKGHTKKSESHAVIGQVDLLASLAALTGQSVAEPKLSDSQNHLSAILGDSPVGRGEIICGQRKGALIIRRGDWKLIRTKRPQLYNLKLDIAEKNNLAHKYPEKVKSLTDALREEVDRYQLKVVR